MPDPEDKCIQILERPDKHPKGALNPRLSAIKKYHKGEKQFILAQDLYNSAHLSQKDRCSLNFALAKMYEDIGEFDKAFGHLYEGNKIRKKVLNYIQKVILKIQKNIGFQKIVVCQ